jgi:hypothetical protein
MSLLLFSACSLKRIPFNLKWYNKYTEKAPARFIRTEGLEKLKSFAFQKVAIVDFTVEYLVDLPESVYTVLADELYQIFVETLSENTEWEIVDGRLVSSSPIYQRLDKIKSLPRFDPSQQKKGKYVLASKTYAPSHLGILLTDEINQQRGSVRSSDNEWLEAGILEQVGADAALKVHTVLDYYQKKGKGRLVIVPEDKKLHTATQVVLYLGYTKSAAPGVGFPGPDGKKYIYKYDDHCSLILKRPLISYTAVRSKKGVFNLEEYIFRAHEMFTIYTAMLATTINAQL